MHCEVDVEVFTIDKVPRKFDRLIIPLEPTNIIYR